MVHRYLMFFEDEKAMVIQFGREVDGKMKSVTNRCEKRFLISDDFWKWWEHVTSYSEEEKVDLCFIYDKDYRIMHRDFNMVEHSQWNKHLIEEFFSEMTNYSNIKLISEKGGECQIENHEKKYADKSEVIFKTNLEFESWERGEYVINSEGKQMSLLVIFFREILKAENIE